MFFTIGPQTHFNNGTPDSTDSYAYPPQQSNGYFQNQYQSEPHTVPNYYPHQQQLLQQQQQQQQGYYNADTYYQNNGVNYYSEHSRSPEYYQQSVPQLQQQQQQHQQQQQQQFGYNSYQGLSSPAQQWHHNNAFIEQQQQHHHQHQQQQRTFMKTESTSPAAAATATTTSPSFSGVPKREMCSHALNATTAGVVDPVMIDETGARVDSNSNANISNNFFFDNFPELQTSCEASAPSSSSTSSFNVPSVSPGGRLPSMTQFGFSQEMSYKLESGHQQKAAVAGFANFANEAKPTLKNDRITDHLKEKKKSREKDIQNIFCCHFTHFKAHSDLCNL